MDRSADAGELTPPVGGVEFRLATAADDAPLRRLLRENPMAGDIRVSLEREPNYFAAAAIEGPEHRTIVAVEDGRVICAGGISARLRHVNGRPARVGYLGGLRLDATARNRPSVVRRGYELFRRLHEAGGPTVYLTSIVADNRPARRLLERGLRGMPVYSFLGDFVTLVVGRRPGGDFCERRRASALRRLGISDLEWVSATKDLVPALAELLNRDGSRYQFAPVWSVEDLLAGERCPGLDVCNNLMAARPPGGTLVACAALWDQRAVKQTVVRSYAPRIRRLRPLVNLAAAVSGRPRLPATAQAVRHAFMSHVVADPAQPRLVEWFVRLLHGPARARGIDYLVLGFDARDPRLPHVRKMFRPREYPSRLYVVHWDQAGADVARGLDGRLLAPEVALL